MGLGADADDDDDCLPCLDSRANEDDDGGEWTDRPDRVVWKYYTIIVKENWFGNNSNAYKFVAKLYAVRF